jgi:biotin transport system ATP-binding protein
VIHWTSHKTRRTVAIPIKLLQQGDMDQLTNKTVPCADSDVALADLCFAIEGKEILKSISLQTSARRVGIVGRNGSGKSTLARVLAGLVVPKSGSVLINGCDVVKDRKAALAEVGILFQNPDHQIIFPTVLEEITFGLTQQGLVRDDAAQKAHATLDSFGKSHWAEAYVNTLSQGQKHLVCLMAIVAMKPRMIILDEPYSGLDIPIKHQLRRYLMAYPGHIVHITHDPADLNDYDHVVWLEDGTIAQSGEADEVLSAYVAQMNELGETDDISDLSD